MRWQLGRRSSNIEVQGGGGSRGIGVKGGAGGVLAMAFVVYLLGGDPFSVLLNGLTNLPAQSRLSPEQEKEQTDFVSAVLGNTEDVWASQFKSIGRTYDAPSLVLFSGAVNSACGYAQSAVGPFYCPNDQKVYLDLSFFQQLSDRLDAPGDFARAYVIAHEVGHHVQYLLGTEEKVHAQMQSSSKAGANALSVKLELQADCYAGVWGHAARDEYNLLEDGDAEEALNAASQIGDDKLQTESQGYAVPDSFTHGTSAERNAWFSRGFKSGKISDCDTFK